MSVLVRHAGSLPRWTIAVGDQGLVAILNLSLSIVVTQIAGVAALGRFAIVNTTILLALGVTRLLVTDPWLASRSAPSTADGRLRALVLTCAVGNAAVVAVVVALATGGTIWYVSCLVAFALVFQDFGRYTAFKLEQPARAVVSDLTVLAVAVVALPAFGVVSDGVGAVLLAWAAGTVAGALVAVRWAGLYITRAGAGDFWLRYCRPLATKLALDTVAYLLATNVSLYLLAYLGTQQDVGVVRIVQTVFSPATLVVTGLSMWLVPFLANRTGPAAETARRRVTIWLAAGSVPAVLLAVVVGPFFITQVFGVRHPPGVLPLALAGVATVGIAVSAPAVAVARVSGHYLPIAWSRGLSAVLTLAGLLLVTWLRGADGYLGLLAIQSLMVAFAAMYVGLKHDRSDRASVDPSMRPRRDDVQEGLKPGDDDAGGVLADD